MIDLLLILSTLSYLEWSSKVEALYLIGKTVAGLDIRVVYILALKLDPVEASVVIVSLGHEPRDEGVLGTVGPAPVAAPLTVKLISWSQLPPLTVLTLDLR